MHGPLRLQWVSVGLLQPDEFYVVSLTDQTTGALFNDSTRDTFLQVPLEYVPTDGQAHHIVWSVTVELRQPDGLLVPVGGQSIDAEFIWE